MATILNLESVEEIQDFQENWKFSSSEIKQILQLRVDFISEEIKRLRLWYEIDKYLPKYKKKINFFLKITYTYKYITTSKFPS